MLSLILYGRNDSYGYNLHKRAAISLNCMAEMLTSPDDEIIFVDYNTPDDFPTFPEAIQDTLTARAKKLLRILRVRPSQHAPFKHLTSLVALEPIARNVAVRRSNPANRWVLSTNTDMVFVPQRGATLSEIVATLPDAYYPLPRFEVPETLWESADRLDPKATIETFGAWGRSFHLNEIVLGADPTVKYDAPGDFQLVLRSDLWDMHGFHEGMLLGWHVDSNLAKRLSLIPRNAGEILDDVFGYHCDHTRQVTPAHKPRAAENDLGTFFAEVTIAQIPEQAVTWGLAGEVVEEIAVNATSRLYLEALRSVTPMPLSGLVPRIQYAYEHHNRIDYAVEHVLPFVADAVASYPRDTVIGWFGSKRTLLERFAQAWRAMGFTKDILLPERAKWLGPNPPAGCTWEATLAMIDAADVFLFDWGRRDGVSEETWDFRTDEAAKGTLRALRLAVRAERRRLAEGGGPARRFIGVNAVCNDAEQTFHELVGAARTPIATRLRQGYASEFPPHMNLLPVLNAGDAARKVFNTIVARPGVPGCVFYLSHMLLESGTYQLRFEFDVASEAELIPGYTGIGLAVTTNSCLIYNRPIAEVEARAGALVLDFIIPPGIGADDDFPETEFQMRTLGCADISIRGAVLDKALDSDAVANLTDFDLFPLLTVGGGGAYGPAPESARRNGKARAAAIRSRPGIEDFLVFGPHMWFLPGRYEATFEFWIPVSAGRRAPEGRVEIVSAFGARIHAEAFVEFSPHAPSGESWQCVRPVLGFDIWTEAPPVLDGLLEFRVWSESGDLSLVALNVHRVGEPGPARPLLERLFGGRLNGTREAVARHVRRAYVEHLAPPNVLWLAQAGPAGKRVPGAIEAVPGVVGVLAHGPYVWLLPGHYEVTFELFGESSATGPHEISLEVVIELGLRIFASDVVTVRSGAQECTLRFDITSDAPAPESGLLEFRVWSPGTFSFRLTAVRVREVESAQDTVSRPSAPRQVGSSYREGSQPLDVLRRLQAGPAGRKTANAIEAIAGQAGVVAYGPYIRPLPGRYEVAFELNAQRVGSGTYIRLEIVAERGNRIFAERLVEPHWHGRRFERALGRRRGSLRYTLTFDIAADLPDHDGLLEFRVWSPGTIPFKLTAVCLRQLEAF